MKQPRWLLIPVPNDTRLSDYPPTQTQIDACAAYLRHLHAKKRAATRKRRRNKLDKDSDKGTRIEPKRPLPSPRTT